MTKNYPVITIGNETAQPYVQQYPFYTGTKVNVLTPIKDLSEYILFFLYQLALDSRNQNIIIHLQLIQPDLKNKPYYYL